MNCVYLVRNCCNVEPKIYGIHKTKEGAEQHFLNRCFLIYEWSKGMTYEEIQKHPDFKFLQHKIEIYILLD